jgi:hypothetical protein
MQSRKKGDKRQMRINGMVFGASGGDAAGYMEEIGLYYRREE